MCLPLDQTSLLCWLHTQVRVLEAWREELAMQAEMDISQVDRLERHYQWLTSEIAMLEDGLRQAA